MARTKYSVGDEVFVGLHDKVSKVIIGRVFINEKKEVSYTEQSPKTGVVSVSDEYPSSVVTFNYPASNGPLSFAEVVAFKTWQEAGKAAFGPGSKKCKECGK